MSNLNIFQNNAKAVPESDEQIVRIDLSNLDIGGRKSHLPAQQKSGSMNLSHVPNAGSTTGK